VQNGHVLIIGTDRSAELYAPGAQTFPRIGSLPSLIAFSGFRNSAIRR
jgi:hypothetical protein